MATVSSHILNSVDGTHAGDVAAALFRIDRDDARALMFKSVTNEGGRLSQSVDLYAPDGHYEMVFQTGDYFAGRSLPEPELKLVEDIVIRFAMPDPEGTYHIPLMIAPNSYSVWWPG